jgi:general secretion pathway protein C
LGLLVIAFLAWLLSDVTNSLIENSLNRATVAVGEKAPPAEISEVAKAHPEDYYGPIIERNIFDSRNLIAPEDTAAFGPNRFLNIPEGVAVKSNLPFTLIGTVVYPKPEDSACTIMDDKKVRGYYKVGDPLQQVTIASIKRKRVEFLNSGVLEYIEIPEVALEPNKPSTLVAGYKGAAGGGGGPEGEGGAEGAEGATGSETIVTVDEGHYIVDRREVESAFDNLNNLLREARVIPDKTGFKFVAIKRNSIYSKLGLRRGDVLQRVNGVDIETPEKAFQVFQQLKNQNSITIDLIRNGTGKTIQYEIR